jgi:hypothetical protein
VRVGRRQRLSEQAAGGDAHWQAQPCPASACAYRARRSPSRRQERRPLPPLRLSHSRPIARFSERRSKRLLRGKRFASKTGDRGVVSGRSLPEKTPNPRNSTRSPRASAAAIAARMPLTMFSMSRWRHGLAGPVLPGSPSRPDGYTVAVSVNGARPSRSRPARSKRARIAHCRSTRVNGFASTRKSLCSNSAWPG